MNNILSFSSLKAFSKSPEHYLAYKSRTLKPSSAMEFGTAVHMAVLEPNNFSQEYELSEGRKGSKIYKLQLEKGKKLLNKSDWDACHRIQERVWTHPMGSELLSKCTMFENKVEGNIFGHQFRGIVDGYAPDFIVDLKTTKDGSPREFSNSVWRLKYHLQAVIYLELTGQDEFWILAVENTHPFVVTAYRMDDQLIERGRQLLGYLLQKFEEWDGSAGGYDVNTPNGFFDLHIPDWVK